MQYSNTQIFDLNQIERDKWVSEFIINNFLTPGKIVLDVGAGTSPYKHLLSHLKYISHDFGEYLGEKLGGTTDYAKIDIKSDITDIPLSDQSVDYLLCTEVLEHVPYPIQAIKEFSRLLKPNGIACITVPFTSGSHQEPFHFYAGFSLNFFKKMCSDYEFEFIEHYQHGGFLRLMAQEILLHWRRRMDLLNMKVTKARMFGLILAGGYSRRMGQDKALLEFNGKPQIETIVLQIRSTSSQRSFIGKLSFLMLPTT